MKKFVNKNYARIVVAAALLLAHSARASGPVSLDGVTLTDVVPRIVTPNGDMLNDVVFFKFDSTITGLPIDSEIYDINGAKVSSLAISSNQTALTWNGRDDSGRAVPSGIYIYSITLGNKRATGTLVVAR